MHGGTLHPDELGTDGTNPGGQAAEPGTDRVDGPAVIVRLDHGRQIAVTPLDLLLIATALSLLGLSVSAVVTAAEEVANV